MANWHGWAGKILRVDLTEARTWTEDIEIDTAKKWVGGVGLAAKYIFEEVPPGVEWNDPENRLIINTGPLAGTGVAGAATINVAAKGPMPPFIGPTSSPVVLHLSFRLMCKSFFPRSITAYY